MLKTSFYMGISVLFVILLSGCFNDDEKAEELIEYYNGWLEIRSGEPQIGTFIQISSERDVERLEKSINENVLPVFKESVAYLEDAALEHKDIQQLNELHIELERNFLEVFLEINDVLKEGSRAEVDQVVNEDFIEQNDLEVKADKFHEEREKLMDKYEVYWIIEYDEYGNELERLGRDR